MISVATSRLQSTNPPRKSPLVQEGTIAGDRGGTCLLTFLVVVHVRGKVVYDDEYEDEDDE
jgi:hypothetical protein